MNLSKQIRYFRNRDGMSQEELAEKIYVSRQTISNWENEKSYPDIHNLLILSVLFNISLDDLVKGDVEIMKEKLQKSNLFKWAYVMMGFTIALPISIAPSMYFFGNYGLVIPLVLFILLIFPTLKVEKIKKENNLTTYRQIIAFLEGKTARKIEAPNKKDKLFKSGLILASALIGFVLAYLGMSVFGL